MNKTMQQPNGPGPSLAEQVRMLQPRNVGTRLIGAPDSPHDAMNAEMANYKRKVRKNLHRELQGIFVSMSGMVIGTAQR